MTVACQERILIVEDEEDLALILQCRLEAAGYEVHIELRGASGLQHAREESADLVILVLRLPDMEGHDVCRELRKQFTHEDLPVLMFTVMNEPLDDFQGFAAGADAYLPKACDPSHLLDTIERLLHGEEIPVGPRF